jgi:hypothetical protein
MFRHEVLPNLPVELLSDDYHDAMGRRTKDLYTMLGVMILQQMEDATDVEACRQFAFNMQWQCALNVIGESDDACYISPKTLWTIRDRLSRPLLDKPGKPLPKTGYELIFETVSNHLAKVFAVDTTKQRLDSTHLFSNMRHLGRIGVFTRTIKKFLVNLKRQHKELFTALGKELTDRYLGHKGASVFSMVKPSESAKTLEMVAGDLFALIEGLKNSEAVLFMPTCQLATSPQGPVHRR